jgi:rubredoxin
VSESIANSYVCDSCNYLYQAANFDGIDFDSQPNDFECPNCQSAKDHFHLFQPASDDVAPSPDGSVDNKIADVDPSGTRVMYRMESSPTLASLQLQFQRKRLDTQPEFQRYEVWSQQKKSALIESILLDLPIPQVFLAQEPDNTSVVIDGQQRMMAIFRYLDDEYALKGVVSAIEGRTFSQLPADLQEKIENYELRVVKILKESDPEVRFTLFQRLNEGSVSLNDQELRNCVWRGPYNEFLKEIAESPSWHNLLNLKRRHPRMADVELALRFFAFRDQQYLAHPDKKTGKFLDKQMVIGEGYADKDYVAARADFLQAIELARTVFGPHACRRFVAGNETGSAGRWDSKLNRALMDVQLWGFSRYQKDDFVKNAESVREAAIQLMASREFSDLLTHTISEFKRLERRFDLWKQMLDMVLGSADSSAEFVGREEKSRLFSVGAKCSACGEEIASIDDAFVGSAGRSAGGRATKMKNPRVVHRFCRLAELDRT